MDLHKLLEDMAAKFQNLKATRLDMLKSFVFKGTAEQLEPVEELAELQQQYNVKTDERITELEKKLEGLANANT